MDRLARLANRTWLLRGAAVSGLGLLAACGGSGGGGVASTPTPTTVTPTPTPTPTPTSTSFTIPAPSTTPTGIVYDTSEYRATVGAVSMNALAAYNAGATGQGVTIGIVDSGIDATSAEFAGRISAASQNVGGGTSIQDEAGHGTAVAFTAAGRMNGVATEGVAFNATLLVLRADTPGTCTASSGADAGCSFNDDNIAKGVDVARVNGARVINISLGGTDAASAALIAAVNRATAAGIVIVIAAGNSGASATGANPEASAEFANNDAVSRNLVIVAGSVGANNGATAGADAISTFSNRAGDTANHYLTAVGERVRAPDQTGTAYLWTGTSFATPQIAGAVALLAQAFPTLTGAQIVAILYATARDAGATGIDAVYGRGVIDLTRAFQPVGITVVAGSRIPASSTSNGALSAAMGDARSGPLGAVVIDSYNRAFAVDLAQTIMRSAPTPMLAPALTRHLQNMAFSQGGMTAAMTLTSQPNGDVILQRTSLTNRDAHVAQAVAGTITQKLGKTLSFGMGIAQGGGVVTAQLAGESRPAFLVAQDDAMGFDTRVRSASAMRAQLGQTGITAAVEQGDVLSQREALIAGHGNWRRSGYSRATLTLDRHAGPVAATLAGTMMDERDSVLGAHFDSSLGGTRATSWFGEMRLRLDAGGGWSAGASTRQGWTSATLTSGGNGGGGGLLRTNAFAADLGKSGVFGHDSVGLRVSQPLRVMRGGGIDLTLPTAYDYDSASVTQWTTQRMNLAPSGREIDIEMRYARPWLGGLVQTNLFWRRDPNNYAALAPDRGMALRWSTGF